MSGVLAAAAVAARIAAVANTAKVWNSLDTTVDVKVFADRFKSGAEIHVWEVTREGSDPVETGSSQAILRREKIVAYGFYSYKLGVSEPVFQAEIDSIVAAFDPPRTRQLADGIEWSTAPVVDGPRLARFGEYVVHFVRLTILVDFDPIF